MLSDSGHPAYDNDQLVALCGYLLPEDPSLAEEVRMAVDRPDVYWATLQPRRRLQFADDAPPQDLPWMALLNGLLARHRLGLLDWRATPREVMAEIDRLLHYRPPDATRWAWVDETSWEQTSTLAFLEAIGQRLLGDGLVLTFFPLDSDMYPIGLIAEERFQAIQKQAAVTGYGELEPLLPADSAERTESS